MFHVNAPLKKSYTIHANLSDLYSLFLNLSITYQLSTYYCFNYGIGFFFTKTLLIAFMNFRIPNKNTLGIQARQIHEIYVFVKYKITSLAPWPPGIIGPQDRALVLNGLYSEMN